MSQQPDERRGYYDIKLTNGDKFLVSSEEVAEVLKAKADGFEFIRIRTNFFNPKYIVSILPNWDMNNSYPKGDYFLGNDDKIITQQLDTSIQKKLEPSKPKQIT